MNEGIHRLKKGDGYLSALYPLGEEGSNLLVVCSTGSWRSYLGELKLRIKNVKS